MLGIQVQGDLGPWTIYTDRKGRKKWFLYSPPTKPPTPNQLVARNRFRTAVLNWKALTAEQKFNLEEACRRLSLCITGQNLFVSTQLTHKQTAYATVARQSRLTLPEAPTI